MNEQPVILNLTPDHATEDQRRAGVVDLPPTYANIVKEALTFGASAAMNEMDAAANRIKSAVLDFLTENRDELEKKEVRFMLGGDASFMGPLARALREIGTPVYSVIKTDSAERGFGGFVSVGNDGMPETAGDDRLLLTSYIGVISVLDVTDIFPVEAIEKLVKHEKAIMGNTEKIICRA